MQKYKNNDLLARNCPVTAIVTLALVLLPKRQFPPGSITPMIVKLFFYSFELALYTTSVPVASHNSLPANQPIQHSDQA